MLLKMARNNATLHIASSLRPVWQKHIVQEMYAGKGQTVLFIKIVGLLAYHCEIVETRLMMTPRIILNQILLCIICKIKEDSYSSNIVTT